MEQREGPVRAEPEEQLPETSAETAYRELAEDEADRLYRYAMLLLGDGAVAEHICREAFGRVWRQLTRGELFGEQVDVLYRTATRAALRRLMHSKELRGHLPPTTADDRQITAIGILSNLATQQRAAILLAAGMGAGYRLAGVASGVGEARTRDLVFAARQEYRQARNGPPDVGSECHQAAPLISAGVDGAEDAAARSQAETHLADCPVCQETDRLFQEFTGVFRGVRIPSPSVSPVEAALDEIYDRPARRPGFSRRLVQLAWGPALLTVVLVAGLFVFQQCEGSTVRTGVGRTSDIAFVSDGAGGGIRVLDSGSGRVVGRLPAGVVPRTGSSVVSASPVCRAGGCVTVLRSTDLGTLETRDLGRLDGQMAVVAVDEEAGLVYLADLDAASSRLIEYSVSSTAAVGSVSGPSEIGGPFGAVGAALGPDRRSLLTLGRVSETGAVALVRTDLAGRRVVGWLGLPGPASPELPTVTWLGDGRGAIYDPHAGLLYETDASLQRIERSLVVDTAPRAEPRVGWAVAMAAASDGHTLYCVLGGGGVAVVDRQRFEVVARVASGRMLKSLAVSTDGRVLYGLEADGAYVVLDVGTGEALLRRAEVGGESLLRVAAGE